MNTTVKAKKIAVAGFIHETNSFAEHKASFDDFTRADGWPALTMGKEMLSSVVEYGLAVAGFIRHAKQAGAELVPLLWCSAQPCGLVTRDAFERIMGMILFDLKRQLPVDAVYLDLHGAMVSESYPDGEGEILRRIRKVVGESVPIVASLDFHANVSPLMVEQADMLVGFRTYPHTDMPETGERAAKLLLHIIEMGKRPQYCFKQLPFLVPITAQTTLIEPARSLYDGLDILEEKPGILSASLWMGFPPSDTPHTGPSMVVYGYDGATVNSTAKQLHDAIMAKEPEFLTKLWQPDGAVRFAMLSNAAKPVVIADTQDNPGAGSSSDTIGMLEALIRNKAQNAVLAAICDPAVAALAHRMGEGKIISCEVGAKAATVAEKPVLREWRVERIGNGDFIATGAMYGGNRMQLGPMALLAYEGVKVIITSERQQAATQAMFTHVGVEPAHTKILVLKSSVHFRADFADIASDILIVESPGGNVENPENLPYKHLREKMRRLPKRK